MLAQSPRSGIPISQRVEIDAIAGKVLGSTEEQEKTAVQHLEIREIMGGKLMQEITLK